MIGQGRHRRRWIVVGGLLVVALLVAGSVWWVRRNPARPVSLDEARQRTGSTTGDTTAPIGAPAAGVYEYRGSGSESLSVPPLSQQEGPTIPGTVSAVADGCWQLRIDFSTNHWQTWRYCREGADLIETGGQTWQRWMVGPTAFTNLTTATCDATMSLPGDRTEGQEWPARCVATNDAVKGETVSAGPLRFVGDEDVDVGGTTVRAAHFVRQREMTGSQQGTEEAEVWLAADTGLPLRNQRTIRAKTDTPIGTSTYDETGQFELTSMQPT